MQLVRISITALFASSLASAAATRKNVKRSPLPTFENGVYLVDEQAEYANHVTWDFSGGNISEGLEISNYAVNDQRRFSADNAIVRDGYLELIQSAGSTTPLKGGEIATSVDNIMYASVRTVAIFSEVPGTCNGIFFYDSDTQETDIEWLSDPNSQSNGGTRKLWLTNQDTNGDGKTYKATDPPADPTNTEHEYRIDWTEGRVQWFVDGEQVWETGSDVPTVPGPWIWNNWSNGDPGWSAGPPTEDAIFKIRSIDMYYNTA